MRRFIASTLGLLAAAVGILIHTPDKDTRLRPLQIVVNELSWVTVLLGGLAALLGLSGKQRAWFGVIGGVIGGGLAAVPLMQHEAAAKDMESAMHAGLGKDYERKIPAAFHRRVANTIWSIPNALGGRERSSRARLWRDVVYANPNGRPLKLDIYQPMIEPAVGNLYPAVIVIHGGGWRNGDKGDWFVPTSRYLANQGYVVFDIQYRLSGRAHWPAPYDDVKTAIRWVKQCAGDYQVDADRIAVLGRSAGGHLAMMAGFQPDADTQVQAIISLYGPADLQWKDLSPDSATVQLMGGTFEQMPEAYAEISPITHVKDGLPPTLMIEGMMDTIVPSLFHGDAMMNKLSLTDTSFVLLRVPWGRHGFDAVTFGLGSQLVQYHIDRFLAWSLYREDLNA